MRRFNLRLGIALLSTVAVAGVPPPPPRVPALVRYAANLGLGPSVVNVTNAGTTGGVDTTDYICANVYVFAQEGMPGRS